MLRRLSLALASRSAVAACAPFALAQAAAPDPADSAESSSLSEDELRTVRMFEASCDSVVFVTNVRHGGGWFAALPGIPVGSGSGFVWDASGHIVTNFHVVQGASELTVTTASQEVFSAVLVGSDPDRDVAVLRVVEPSKAKLRPLPLGSSASLRVGQRTYAIGCPFGLDHTLTQGIVSGLGRDMLGRAGRPITNCIQTDAALNPGSSGGPLLNSAGQVIGMATAILTSSGVNAGVGMAVPIDAMRLSVEQILAHGRVVRPSLGVRMAPDHFVRHRLGVSGVLVFEVQPGSGAERAGLRGTRHTASGQLQLGDVIVAIDGTPVGSSLDLFKVMEAVRVGDSVTLDVVAFDTDGSVQGLREKGRRTVQVKVAAQSPHAKL